MESSSDWSDDGTVPSGQTETERSRSQYEWLWSTFWFHGVLVSVVRLLSRTACKVPDLAVQFFYRIK